MAKSSPTIHIAEHLRSCVNLGEQHCLEHIHPDDQKQRKSHLESRLKYFICLEISLILVVLHYTCDAKLVHSLISQNCLRTDC